MTRRAFPAPDMQRGNVNCPCCRQMLAEGADTAKVMFEICARCGLVWVDLGALEQKQAFPYTPPPQRQLRAI